MSEHSEIIDLGITKIDNEPISIKLDNNFSNTKTSMNSSSIAGPEIQLLMNEKKNVPKQGNTESIEDLENELNMLSDVVPEKSTLNLNPQPSPSLFSVKIDESKNESINLGPEISKPDNETWDGYKKFNDIPVNPGMNVESLEPKMTKEELLKEKFCILRKLEDLERKGVSLTKKYSMDSNLAEMKGEYEMIISEKERKNSVKFQQKMLMACVTGLEFLNNKFDPFDVNLDGWGESVNENVTDYDEVFAELHEKYKSKAKMAPELKLLFMLGGSAIMVHMTNSMFKSSIPGMDDIMRQNPELMKQFTQAAASSMQQEAPNMSNFMSSFGGPPQQPQQQQQMPPFGNSQQTERFVEKTNRPDIQQSRAPGMSVNNFGTNLVSEPEKTPRKRPEMKGPSNIDDILANLKPKQVNIKKSREEDASSMISVEDLRKRDNDFPKPTPKKNRKKPVSERNSVSLDI